LTGLLVAEQRLQLENVLRERVGADMVATQREHRQLVGTGRATEAEIDAPRMKRRECPELLCNHERRVIRQHDPTGADSNRLRACGDVPDHDRGGGARDASCVVMLREPKRL
jgi:hypothetical protein